MVVRGRTGREDVRQQDMVPVHGGMAAWYLGPRWLKSKCSSWGSGYCLFVRGVLSLGQVWLRRNPRSGGQGSGGVGTLVGFCFVGCQKPRSSLADGQNARGQKGKTQRRPGKSGGSLGEVVVLARASSPAQRPTPSWFAMRVAGGQQFGGPAPLGALCNGLPCPPRRSGRLPSFTC